MLQLDDKRADAANTTVARPLFQSWHQLGIAWACLIAFSEVLRRCLVPVVAAVLMMGLLFLPQSQEFMDGLLLLCDSSSAGCSVKFGVRAHAIQFLVFELLAFLFSLEVWYAARVLVCVRTATGAGSSATLFFEQWLPRIVGAVPLYLMSLALFEPFGTWLSVPQLLLGFACASSLVLAPIFLHVRYPAEFGRSNMVWGVAVGLLALVICTVQPFPDSAGVTLMASWGIALCFYSYFAWRLVGKRPMLIVVIGVIEAGIGWILINTWQVAAMATAGATLTWTVPVAMLLPAGFLVLIIFHRDFGWHLLGKALFASIDRQTGFSKRSAGLAPRFPREAVLLLLVALILGALVCFAVIWDPDLSARFLFAPAAVVLWLLVTLLASLAFLFVLPLHLRFLAVALLLALTYFGGVPPAPLLQAESDVPPNMCNDRTGVCAPNATVQGQYRAWQSLHGGADDTQPIVVVAAAGGGARAAAHTATMLAAVDAATCGHFGERIFAISAVSGGALGAAAYSASREDLGFLRRPQLECLRKFPGRDRPSPLVPPLIALTSADHLSSSLIRALFRDLPLSVLPSILRPDEGTATDYYSRAGVLYSAWWRDYKAMVDGARMKAKLQVTTETALTRSAGSAGTADGRGPYLLFNATSVQDGRRVVLGSPLLCPYDGYCAVQPGYLLGNALDSARFPLISPPHNRDVYGWKRGESDAFATQLSLVDGGYVDNSGILTLLDVIDGLLADGVKSERIYAIVISSDPNEGTPRTAVVNYADTGLLAQVLAPIHAVINSCDGHAERAARDLRGRLAASNIIYWELGKLSRNQIDAESKATLQKLPEVEMMERLHGKQVQKRLQRDPALGWALSQESAQIIWRKTNSRQWVYAEPVNSIYEYEKSFAQRLKEGEETP